MRAALQMQRDEEIRPIRPQREHLRAMTVVVENQRWERIVSMQTVRMILANSKKI